MILQEVKEIIKKLNNTDFKAYIVGGAVRNILTGITPLDFDLTTDALPDQIMTIFKDYPLYTVGKKHGTIAIILNDQKFEITTMRTDGEYTDFRHPKSVMFTKDLKSDLSRRDFTMNAMAMSLDGEVIDYFGGLTDLKNKILRAVGKPESRFKEDPLRILRALRFASEYGLTIDDKSRNALFFYKNLLNKIAPERISEEFSKTVCGKFAGQVILEYNEIISVFIPEITACRGFLQKSKYHKYDILEHICKSIDAVKPEKALRLTMFFHDIGKPFSFQEKNDTRHFKGHAEQSFIIAKRVFKRLRYDSKTTNTTLFLIKFHDYLSAKKQLTKKSVQRMMLKFGYNRLKMLCEIHKADDSAKADFVKERVAYYEKILNIAKEISDSGECYTLKNLAVNGHDIISLGFEGKTVGKIKNRLLYEVIENNLPNNKDILKNFIDKNRNMW
ncbi:MAG: HD domain-containing protein [Eubacterium sp.]|jgi:tRNA nucleotidyltransferase (CCA-adding enzyme)|nr:HD domain-containing protein [Eubacterium sp.]